MWFDLEGFVGWAEMEWSFLFGRFRSLLHLVKHRPVSVLIGLVNRALIHYSRLSSSGA